MEIELIGDNVVQMCKLYRNTTNGLVPGLGSLTFGCPPSGWVAEITGFDDVYKYKREFLRYRKDYSRANSKGSRGVFAEYILESGKVYDVRSNKNRYFCTVNEQGDIVKIQETEVKEWLKNRSESTSSQQPDSE